MPFWNALIGSQEVKAILRIGEFSLLWLVVWLPFGIPMSMRFQWYPFRPLPVQQKLILLLPLYGIAVPILWEWAKLQGILVSTYGLEINPRLFSDFWVGLAVGLLSLGVLFALEYGLGWMLLNPTLSSPAAGNPEARSSPALQHFGRDLGIIFGLLLLSAGISFVEELLFRGFLWTELQTDGQIQLAAIATSVIFAVLHCVWDGWESRSQLWGLTLMGLVLCTARWADDNLLGMAWGLHTGWIWAIASFDQLQILTLAADAPTWLTGKPGQPLTGIFTGLLLLLTGLGFWGYGSGG